MKLKTMLAAAVATAACATAAAPAGARLPVPYGNEAVAAFVKGEVLTPTHVPGANNPFCRPSPAHPYPVVLVHGTFEDEGSNWVTLAPLLANAGYCVYAFNYGETGLSLGGRVDGLNFIEHSAQELAAFVNEVLFLTHRPRVDIVGHSQGGMMPNYYVKFLGGAERVHSLIGLAPSNHGTTVDGLVTLLQKLPFAEQLGELIEDIGAPSVVQQEVGSQFITHLFAGGDTVPGPRYVVIESAHDEVVTPFTNAFLAGPNVTNVLVQAQCPSDPTAHVGMNWDSPSLQDVLNQLSLHPNPSFQPSCTNFGSPF
jgi:triacylglycerol esterase/lipase EstA (alpha/beta hydrolase family)